MKRIHFKLSVDYYDNPLYPKDENNLCTIKGRKDLSNPTIA
jgi:hypothetical protein